MCVLLTIPFDGGSSYNTLKEETLAEETFARQNNREILGIYFRE